MKAQWTDFITLLKREVVPALGCTEPMSVALAAANCRKLLGQDPTRISVWVSGNLFKNGMGVGVPGTGMIGLPVAAAVGLANLRILKEEKILEKVREETAPYLQKRLRELADHPLVGEVRGVGMLGAIELAKNKQTRERFPSEMGVGMICRGHCFENGLIMRAVGDTMIIAPPLVISKDEIDELVEKARKCLDLTARAVLV